MTCTRNSDSTDRYTLAAEWGPVLTDIELQKDPTSLQDRGRRRCEKANCGASAVLRCDGCKLVKYCSRSCQSFDKHRHRQICFPTNLRQSCERLYPLVDIGVRGSELGTRFPLCRDRWYLLLTEDLFPSAALYIFCNRVRLIHQVGHLLAGQKINLLFDPVTGMLALQGRGGIVVGCWRDYHLEIVDELILSSE